MYWKSFLRAIGLRQSFRPSGPSTWLNLAVAAGMGVVSGYYIFQPSLQQYWSEENRAVREAHQRRHQNEQTSASSSNSEVTVVGATSSSGEATRK